MKKLFHGPLLFPIIFGSVGALLLLTALLFGLNTQRAMQDAEMRITKLQQVTVASLADSSVGRELVIEGRVSERNQPLLGDLVAYTELRTVTNADDETTTVTDADERPPLLIEGADGRLTVRDYRLQNGYSEPGARSGATRYGVRAGEVVAVGGYVAQSNELPTLERATLLAPPGTSYFEYIRSQARGGWIAVLICGLLGLFFAGFATIFFSPSVMHLACQDDNAQPERLSTDCTDSRPPD